MNILYHFRTRGTGPESVHIAGIAGAFEELGHKVTFSNPAGADPLKSAGASPYGDRARKGFLRRVVDLCPGFLFEFLEMAYNFSAWRRNSALLRKAEFGLIYERHAFFLFVTAALARRRGIPFIVEVNELVGDDRVRRQPLFVSVARACDRFAFSRAGAIVTVSPHLKRRIEGMGVDPDRILVLPNAVNPADYAEDAPVEDVRRKLGLGADDVVVGFVGWFVEWHRLDLLLESVAELAADRPNLRLLLVGDGDLREELERRADEPGISGKVVFSGAVSHDEIPSHIGAMDVCVVPHSNEFRSPIKLFEYMGRGKTVVAPASEPIRMAVRDRENGLLFDADVAGSLRETLRTAVDDAKLRACLGARAREDALTEHTWLKNAEKTLECAARSEGEKLAGA